MTTATKFNHGVAWAMWSVSAVVIASLAVSFLGLEAPKELATAAGWYVAIVGGLSMMLGIGRSWSLPGNRRLVALACEAFVLIGGVVLVERIQRADLVRQGEHRLEIVKQGIAYKTTERLLNSELLAFENSSGRNFTQEYVTSFRDNEKARNGSTGKVAEYTQKLHDMETAALGDQVLAAPVQTGTDWGMVAVALLLCLAYEGVALTLMFRPAETTAEEDTAPQATTAPRLDAVPQTEAPHRTVTQANDAVHRTAPRPDGGKIQLTRDDFDLYVAKIDELKGKGWRTFGYRPLSEELGWSELKTREMGKRIREAKETSAARVRQ